MYIRNDAGSLIFFAFWDRTLKRPIVDYAQITILLLLLTGKVAGNQKNFSKKTIERFFF